VRHDIHHYFQRALRRLASGTGTDGFNAGLVRSADGLCAGFIIEASGPRIVRADYRCTTCATLVGLCEHLVEAAAGVPASEAAAMDAEWLLARHPEVPPGRRDRAGLAAAAFRAALACLHPQS
jgi:hypothetical protein